MSKILTRRIETKQVEMHINHALHINHAYIILSATAKLIHDTLKFT